jgi:hypothetical protein
MISDRSIELSLRNRLLVIAVFPLLGGWVRGMRRSR